MRARNPVESLAKSVYSAISNIEILPDIERAYRNIKEKCRPDVSDCLIYHFPQMWGSTSLGFGGMGGAAMTSAYTTVIVCDDNAAVFFDGRHAYSIDNFPELFSEDIRKHNMPSVKGAEKYNLKQN